MFGCPHDGWCYMFTDPPTTRCLQFIQKPATGQLREVFANAQFNKK